MAGYAEIVHHIITRGRWRRGEPLALDGRLTVASNVRSRWTINRVQRWVNHPIAYRVDGVYIWPSNHRAAPFCALRPGNVMPVDRSLLWLSRYLETAMTGADRRWPLSL